MAITLVHTCPHCLSERIGFTFLGQVAKPPEHENYWHVFFRCNGCFNPVIAQFHSHLSPYESLHGNLLDNHNIKELEIFPALQPSMAPDHVPEEISTAFLEADEAIRRKSWNAAAAMDRRVLELVTKEQAPDKKDATLYQRIEHLANSGALTASLKEWAHSLRIIGNEALHDMDDMKEHETKQAHNLTRFILTYLYTLPRQVELARQIRHQK